MKRYSHLFFDLDHTLWDYDRNSAITLEQLYKKYQLEKIAGFSLNEFISCFNDINENLWVKFHAGEISKDEIRFSRFEMVFKILGNYSFLFTGEFSNEYIRECPTKGHTVPGTIELLEYLLPNYELYIITNGFEDIQHIKLSTTGLDRYFDQVFISGLVGFRKPQKGIFTHALKKTKALSSTSLMIGDSMESDIIGARSVSMDQVYFNPSKTPHAEEVTYEIENLLELKVIL